MWGNTDGSVIILCALKQLDGWRFLFTQQRCPSHVTSCHDFYNIYFTPRVHWLSCLHTCPVWCDANKPRSLQCCSVAHFREGEKSPANSGWTTQPSFWNVLPCFLTQRLIWCMNDKPKLFHNTKQTTCQILHLITHWLCAGHHRVISSCKQQIKWANWLDVEESYFHRLKDFIESEGHRLVIHLSELCPWGLQAAEKVNPVKCRWAATILGWNIWTCHQKMITWFGFNCKSNCYILACTEQEVIWPRLKAEVFCSTFEKPAIIQRRGTQSPDKNALDDSAKALDYVYLKHIDPFSHWYTI